MLTEPTRQYLGITFDGDAAHPFGNPDAVALLDAYAESSVYTCEAWQHSMGTSHFWGYKTIPTPHDGANYQSFNAIHVIKFLREETECSLTNAVWFVRGWVMYCVMRKHPKWIVDWFERQPDNAKNIYTLYTFPNN